jgi:glycine dehydrogenase subunit 1
MMAARATGRRRVLAARGLHPEYREVLGTYARFQGMPVEEFGYAAETGAIDLEDLERRMDPATAAVIVQSPNFFGVVEQVGAAAEIAHRHGALLVMVFTEAVSLGILEPPGGADIVAGELQSFAISPSYGGPFAGVIATREKYMRQMPGRLVGQTTDSRGNRAFCLTLSTREQHIRREKATSNICTNQALIALMATVFMTVYGKRGLRELAEQNLAKAHYLAAKMQARFSGPFFNEFVARVEGRSPEDLNKALLKKKIIGGLPLGRFYPELADCMLWCATEMSTRANMDAVAEVRA